MTEKVYMNPGMFHSIIVPRSMIIVALDVGKPGSLFLLTAAIPVAAQEDTILQFCTMMTALRVDTDD